MTPPRAFYVHTFGCRLNQFDSSFIGSQLLEAGWRPAQGCRGADVVIINSCTVTHKADAEARRFAARAKRQNPASLVVLTGCLATRQPEIVRHMPQVDIVITNADKHAVATILQKHAERQDIAYVYDGDIMKARELEYSPMAAFLEHTRAFLKVQDGCDARCTFCIIPSVRGSSRSLHPDLVVAQAERFVNAGHKEIVLTGIHLGVYGRDLGASAVNLAALTRRLLKVRGVQSLRFSSIEPLEVTFELVDLAASDERVASHFHVPLQSASDDTLRRMGRPYRLAQYASAVEYIRRRLPDAAIGADVMVGFPSERDEDFEATRRFIEESPLTYLHVFRFSPRPGTPATSMLVLAPSPTVTERSEILRLLSRRINFKFRLSQKNRWIRGLVLASAGQKGIKALTSNYIEAELRKPEGAGEWRMLRIENVGISTTVASLQEPRALKCEKSFDGLGMAVLSA
jgi:threonylcarbamoyladenosine tRNA methylthiotransferase MtaB